MGIPSYFSYIVKNHSNIIKKYNNGILKINNLYLDCNSIIYDSVHNIDFTKLDDTDVNTIIKMVIKKIDEYINLIQPDSNVFIAFDGVAPVAKLEQQRIRRYKSLYQNKITKSIYKDSKPDPWNTTAITPGTMFMSKLNENIRKYYVNPNKYNVKNIFLSLSDKFGEGEHKIFEFIRSFPDYHKNTSSVIYGLDADLIMLSINHLPISDNIYLFRETPHFIKSINSELEPDSNYLMDIPELAKIITLDMNNGVELNTEQQKNRIYDYIFLCFFLGNDFMPHFPSLNIRTGGVDKMMNAYKAVIGGTNENLTDGKIIYWKNVRKLVVFLSNFEEEYIKKEYKIRDRQEKVVIPNDTPENTFRKFESIPIYERQTEKFINPFKSNWQQRYYKSLFNVEIDEDRKRQISTNYLEGLEWTFKYYTSGCIDWRWCYNYNYPPLLSDLIHYIPFFEIDLITKKQPNPVCELVQLCYVLPKECLHLLPSKLHKQLIEQRFYWYKSDCEFIWAFCKYFWESHVDLPDIDINELEEFVKDNK
jgi:5'-3' exonuclease